MIATRQFRQARDRFVALLESPDSLEREWQSLFIDCPFILTQCLGLGIEPRNLIPCKPGKAEADFYFYPRLEDPYSQYGVIELKRPNTAILNTKARKDVVLLSSEAAVAVAQAKKYALDMRAQGMRAKIINPDAHLVVLGNFYHLFVIAGMSAEIARKVTTDLHSAQFASLLPPNCRLVTYDELADLLASRAPSIHVVAPWPQENPRTQKDVQELPQTQKDVRELLQTQKDVQELQKGGIPSSRSFFGPREMSTVKCTECGEQIIVPFKPAKGRPIYCNKCYMKFKPVREF